MRPGGYIAIEGPIGAGKTTLAKRLSQSLSARLLAEAPDDNPFLGAFYDNPAAHALAAQLFFLLQRARQIDDLRQTDLFEGGVIADFMFDKDPLFAQLTLTGAELVLYWDIYKRLSWGAPTPDCVIYLHAPVDVLMARIRVRGRTAERSLTVDYLARVVAAYRAFFAGFTAARLIRVDAAALDLVGSRADYETLLAALAADVPVQNLGEIGNL